MMSEINKGKGSHGGNDTATTRHSEYMQFTGPNTSSVQNSKLRKQVSMQNRTAQYNQILAKNNLIGQRTTTHSQ